MSLPQGRTLDELLLEWEEAATFKNEYTAHFRDLSPPEQMILKRLITEENLKSLQPKKK